MSGREFLVKRLMEDSSAANGKGSSSSSDGSPRGDSSSPEKSDSTTSSSHTDPGDLLQQTMAAAKLYQKLSSPLAAAKAPLNKLYPSHGLGGAALPPGSPLAAHYAAAATLASLAFLQQQQPASSVSGLSLLYPNLYQSLMSFPDIDEIRRVVQSAVALAAARQQTAAAGQLLCDSLTNAATTKSPAGIHEDETAVRSTLKGSSRKRSVCANNDDNGNTVAPFDSSESPSKRRAIRRLLFDEETSSPVSGQYCFYWTVYA